jgi:hypothetical protein
MKRKHRQSVPYTHHESTGGIDVLLHSFLFSELYGGKRFTRGPGNFTLGEELLYALNWGLDGLQSGFGHFAEEKNLLPLSRIKLPTVQTWASRYTDFACSVIGMCVLLEKFHMEVGL